MWKHLRRAGMVVAALSSASLWLSTHSIPQTVEDADGFIATNLKWAGIDDPPSALATSSADHTVFIISVLLIFFGFICFASWAVEKFMSKDDVDDSDNNGGGDTTHGDGSHIIKGVNGNITVNPPSPSKGIGGNTFENNGVGILIEGGSHQGIENNTFRGNVIGVQIRGKKRPE